MANELDLIREGFEPFVVSSRMLDIVHEDPKGLGPYCRLQVAGDVPELPGVYAWDVSDSVMYVGHSKCLRQVVDGVRMGRPYNDYTYVPPSKTGQISSPRLRINGELNRCFVAEATVRWWCRTCASRDHAVELERRLFHEWSPSWNRATP